MDMDTLKITPGWADKLTAGRLVIVQDAELPARPSLGYRYASVERVTDTEVVVAGVKYRRGPGRSELVRYLNEGIDISAINDVAAGRIWPVTAATRRWLARQFNEDYADATPAQLAADARSALRRAAADGDTAALRAGLLALRGDDYAR